MKKDFIDKFKNNLFGMLGGCVGHTECRVENVEVECHSETTTGRLKKRGIAYVVTIKFEVNLPANNDSLLETKGMELNSTNEILNSTASKFVALLQNAINSSSLDINIGNATVQAARKDGVTVRDVGVKCHAGQKSIGGRCGKLSHDLLMKAESKSNLVQLPTVAVQVMGSVIFS